MDDPLTSLSKENAPAISKLHLTKLLKNFQTCVRRLVFGIGHLYTFLHAQINFLQSIVTVLLTFSQTDDPHIVLQFA